MEIKPGDGFDLGERTVKNVGNDAYSEISAIRSQLQVTRDCLDLAVSTLQDILGVCDDLNSVTQIEQALEKIRKGFYGK